MKRISSIALFFVVLWLFAAGTAFAQSANGESPASAAQIAMILAPLVAAATVIERIIEMIFDWIESFSRSAGGLIKIGGNYVKLARQQVETARQAVNTLLEKSEPDASRLREAENALADAEDRLVDYFSSPSYTTKKGALSMLMGIAGGLIVASSMRLGIVHLLIPGFTFPVFLELDFAWLDYVLTGLVIGTGSAPVHSLIGLLQNTKNAVGEARALMSGKALNEIEGLLAKAREEAAAGGSPPQGAVAASAATVQPSTAAAEPAPAAAAMSDVQVRRLSRRLLG